MKIVTVVGARPQFVKAAALSREFRRRPGTQEILVHTGQHYDSNMSEIFFRQLDIPEPQYNLGVGSGLHGAMTGRQLEGIEQVLLQHSPDWVLVYGDTNSTLAGALAAAKLQIRIAHVEAGLRSYNRAMPEEVNRVLTDHVSTLLLAPTEAARRNLAAEGICGSHVAVVGDVMFDATLHHRRQATEPAWFAALGLPRSGFILATVHRAENTDVPERLLGILKGLAGARQPVLLPLHPRTRAKARDMGLELPANVTVVEPVGYLEMAWLLEHCSAVATDSGGLQKEAYFFAKACTTLRQETEWVELVDAGVNELASADPVRISASLARQVPAAAFCHSLYGDGNAASRIADMLAQGTGA